MRKGAIKVPEQLGRNPAQIILLSVGPKFGFERWQLERQRKAEKFTPR